MRTEKTITCDLCLELNYARLCVECPELCNDVGENLIICRFCAEMIEAEVNWDDTTIEREAFYGKN